MLEFHETKMGYIFYEVTMPDIAKSLREITRLLMVIGYQGGEREELFKEMKSTRKRDNKSELSTFMGGG